MYHPKHAHSFWHFSMPQIGRKQLSAVLSAVLVLQLALASIPVLVFAAEEHAVAFDGLTDVFLADTEGNALAEAQAVDPSAPIQIVYEYQVPGGGYSSGREYEFFLPPEIDLAQTGEFFAVDSSDKVTARGFARPTTGDAVSLNLDTDAPTRTTGDAVVIVFTQEAADNGLLDAGKTGSIVIPAWFSAEALSLEGSHEGVHTFSFNLGSAGTKELTLCFGSAPRNGMALKSTEPVEFKQFFVSVDVTTPVDPGNKDSAWESIVYEQPGDDVEIPFNEISQKEIRIEYKYKVPRGLNDGNGFLVGVPYRFKLPEQIKIPSAIPIVLQADVHDDGNSVAITEGSTVGTDGWVTLKFINEEYMRKLANPPEDADERTGNIWIQASFDRDSLGDGGRQKIDFQVSAKEILIDFGVPGDNDITQTLKLIKEGEAQLNTCTIDWTVRAEATANHGDILGFRLSDAFPQVGEKALTFDPDDIDTGKVTAVWVEHGATADTAGEAADGTFSYESNTNTLSYEMPTNAFGAWKTGKDLLLKFSTGFLLDGFTTSASGEVEFTNKVEATCGKNSFTKNPDTGLPEQNPYDQDADPANLVKADDEGKVKVNAQFISKTGTEGFAARTVEWTLKINEKGLLLPNVVIVDTLNPSGSIQANKNMPITLRERKDNNGNKIGYEVYEVAGEVKTPLPDDEFAYDPNTHTITFSLGELTAAKTIAYVTDVPEGYYQQNNKNELTNSLEFHGEGPGDGWSVTASAKVNVGSTMLTKSSSYDPATHIITWTVKTNDNRTPLSGEMVVTDELPAGLTLVKWNNVDAELPMDSLADTAVLKDYLEVPIDAVQAAYTPAADSAKAKLVFTLAQGTDGTDKYTIRFKTKINETVDGVNYRNKLWGKNTASYSETNLTNTVSAVAPISGNELKPIVSETPKLSSEMLAKTGLGYDPVEKTASWQIIMNQNANGKTKVIPIENAVLTDTLPTGEDDIGKQVFVKDSVAVTVKDKNGAKLAEGTDYTLHISKDLKTMTITFKSPVTQQLCVCYKTKLTDESVLVTNLHPKVANTAKLVGNTIMDDGLKITKDQPVSASFLTKMGLKKDISIEWTVNLNQNRLRVKDAVLTDELQEGLALDFESVKLYKLDAQNVPALVPDGCGVTATPINGGKQQKITFNFKPVSDKDGCITDAYRLVFETFATKIGVTYTNTIKLDGFNSDTGDNSSSVVFQNYSGGGAIDPPNFRDVKIVKADGEGNPLSDVEFTFRGQKLVTNESGEILLYNVKTGSYPLVETNLPAGYYADSTTTTVKVEKGNGPQTVNVVNHLYTTSLDIIKQDAATDEALDGAEFKLEKLSGSFKNDPFTGTTAVTANGGKVTFAGLTTGSYRVTETKAPNGYTLSAEPSRDFDVAIADGHVSQTVKMTFMNKLYSASLEVAKQDAKTGGKLAGAVFMLEKQDGGNWVEAGKKTTGANGQAVFSGLTVGEYRVTEAEAPYGYADLPLAERTQTFTVQVGGAATIKKTFQNTRYLAELTVTKQDKETGVRLAGAEFTLFKWNEGRAEWLPYGDSKLTGCEGTATFVGLPVGRYQAKEMSAPYGYALTAEPFEFTVETDGTALSGQFSRLFENILYRASLEVTKLNGQGQKLGGAEFTLYRQNAKGGWDTVGQPQSTPSEGDSIGIARFTSLTAGLYKISETKTPAGYATAPDQGFEVRTNGGETTGIIRLDCTNIWFQGTVRVEKADSKNAELMLENAVFELRRVSDDSLVGTAATDKKGIAEFLGVDAGEYYLIETQAPAKYQLDNTKHAVSVVTQGMETAHVFPVRVTNVRKSSGTVVPPPLEEEKPKDTPPSHKEEIKTDGKPSVNGKVDVKPGGKVDVDTPPKNGEVDLKPDGDWTYTPDTGFRGKDQFTLRLANPDVDEELLLFEIENNDIPLGMMLPQTAEASPYIWYVGGGALILAGGLLWFLSGRKKRTAQEGSKDAGKNMD